MDIAYFAAMAQLRLYFWARDLRLSSRDREDHRLAIKLMAMGLVKHDRILNGQPAAR